MFFVEKLGPNRTRATPMALHIFLRERFGSGSTPTGAQIRKALGEYLKGRDIDETPESAFEMLLRANVVGPTGSDKFKI